MINLLLAQEAKKLENMSVFVLILVVVLMVVTLFILFYVCYKYYSKCIINGLEDKQLKKSIIAKNKDYFIELERKTSNNKKTAQEKLQSIQSLSSYIENKKNKKSKKLLKIGSVILMGVGYVFLVCVIIVAIIVNIKGNLFYIGNQANLIIVTDSMQTVNPVNTYINENNLTNQIPVNSLITLSPIKNASDINQYDIIAYKDNENKIIVHRVKEIFVEDGVTKYVCRGDSNNASTEFESKLTLQNIIGKFTGFQSYLLGISVVYLRSGIGLVTVMFVFLGIVLYEEFDSKLGKCKNKRKLELVLEIEEEIKQKIKNKEEINYSNSKKNNNTDEGIDIQEIIEKAKK